MGSHSPMARGTAFAQASVEARKQVVTAMRQARDAWRDGLREAHHQHRADERGRGPRR